VRIIRAIAMLMLGGNVVFGLGAAYIAMPTLPENASYESTSSGDQPDSDDDGNLAAAGGLLLGMTSSCLLCFIAAGDSGERKKARDQAALDEKARAARDRVLVRLGKLRGKYWDYVQLRERAHQLISLLPNGATAGQRLRVALRTLDSREEALSAAMVAVGDPDELTTGAIGDGCHELEKLLSNMRPNLDLIQTECDAMGRIYLLEPVS
jgi:hypothetical protein